MKKFGALTPAQNAWLDEMQKTGEGTGTIQMAASTEGKSQLFQAGWKLVEVPDKDGKATKYRVCLSNLSLPT